MSLKTYPILSDFIKPENPDELLVPGAMCFNKRVVDSYGIVVAVTPDDVTVLWSRDPKPLIDYSSFIKPLTRSMGYSSIAQQIFQVQPMPVPSANTFYHEYTYNLGSKEDEDDKDTK